MDKKVLNLLYELSDCFSEDVEKASSNLYKLTQILSELIWDQKVEEMIDIKRTLDDELISEKIQDYRSYNLGKAHTLIELIDSLKQPFEEQELIKSLKQVDKQILRLIEHNKDMTPTQLREELHLKKQYMTNLLGDLRKKELVNVFTVGKYRWYSLALRGKNVMRHLRNELPIITQDVVQNFLNNEETDTTIDDTVAATTISNSWLNYEMNTNEDEMLNNHYVISLGNEQRISNEAIAHLKQKKQKKFTSKKRNTFEQPLLENWDEAYVPWVSDLKREEDLLLQ